MLASIAWEVHSDRSQLTRSQAAVALKEAPASKELRRLWLVQLGNSIQTKAQESNQLTVSPAGRAPTAALLAQQPQIPHAQQDLCARLAPLLLQSWPIKVTSLQKVLLCNTNVLQEPIRISLAKALANLA
jgi:hypothetical protein